MASLCDFCRTNYSDESVMGVELCTNCSQLRLASLAGYEEALEKLEDYNPRSMNARMMLSDLRRDCRCAQEKKNGSLSGGNINPDVVSTPMQNSQPQLVLQSNEIPDRYRPIGAWGYYGYKWLFRIPLLGFILLLVFSFDDSNINRRNFARSYWVSYILDGLLFLVVCMTFRSALLAILEMYLY